MRPGEMTPLGQVSLAAPGAIAEQSQATQAIFPSLPISTWPPLSISPGRSTSPLTRIAAEPAVAWQVPEASGGSVAHWVTLPGRPPSLGGGGTDASLAGGTP